MMKIREEKEKIGKDKWWRRKRSQKSEVIKKM